MSVTLPELVIITAIVAAVALLVIGILIGILVAVFAPRQLERASSERSATNRS
jgi:uncharacterized membrane-anchored protein YhcB (DUF1043 family)